MAAKDWLMKEAVNDGKGKKKPDPKDPKAQKKARMMAMIAKGKKDGAY